MCIIMSLLDLLSGSASGQSEWGHNSDFAVAAVVVAVTAEVVAYAAVVVQRVVCWLIFVLDAFSLLVSSSRN